MNRQLQLAIAAVLLAATNWMQAADSPQPEAAPDPAFDGAAELTVAQKLEGFGVSAPVTTWLNSETLVVANAGPGMKAYMIQVADNENPPVRVWIMDIHGETRDATVLTPGKTPYAIFRLEAGDQIYAQTGEQP